LSDLAYTLQCGREAMPWRFALVVQSVAELIDSLETHLERDSDASAAGRTPMFIGAPADKTSVAAFTTGKAGDALLETFMRERDLESLALLWTKGGRIPWTTLYPGRLARMLALPCYPFNKQRYWLPEALSNVVIQPVGENAIDANPPLGLSLPRLQRFDIVLPRTELEATVQGIWQEVLGFSEIGVFDNFMELGGTSLSAARVTARLKEQYQIDIAIPVLLSAEATIVKVTEAVVSELARQVSMESTAA